MGEIPALPQAELAPSRGTHAETHPAPSPQPRWLFKNLPWREWDHGNLTQCPPSPPVSSPVGCWGGGAPLQRPAKEPGDGAFWRASPAL